MLKGKEPARPRPACLSARRALALTRLLPHCHVPLPLQCSHLPLLIRKLHEPAALDSLILSFGQPLMCLCACTLCLLLSNLAGSGMQYMNGRVCCKSNTGTTGASSTMHMAHVRSLGLRCSAEIDIT